MPKYRIDNRELIKIIFIKFNIPLNCYVLNMFNIVYIW